VTNDLCIIAVVSYGERNADLEDEEAKIFKIKRTYIFIYSLLTSKDNASSRSEEHTKGIQFGYILTILESD